MFGMKHLVKRNVEMLEDHSVIRNTSNLCILWGLFEKIRLPVSFTLKYDMRQVRSLVNPGPVTFSNLRFRSRRKRNKIFPFALNDWVRHNACLKYSQSGLTCSWRELQLGYTSAFSQGSVLPRYEPKPQGSIFKSPVLIKRLWFSSL